MPTVLSPPRHLLVEHALRQARQWCAGHVIDDRPALAHAARVAVTLGEHVADPAPDLVAAILLHGSPARPWPASNNYGPPAGWPMPVISLATSPPSTAWPRPASLAPRGRPSGPAMENCTRPRCISVTPDGICSISPWRSPGLACWT